MQLIFFAILTLLLPLSQQQSSQQQEPNVQPLTFEEFVAKYHLTFPAEELSYRRQIYQGNLTRLKDNPCEWCGITPFFANTYEEMQKKRGLYMPLNIEEMKEKQVKKKEEENFIVTASKEIKFKLTASSSLNWVDQGAVTPPKNQGNCGTCWSFATVAMCESSLILQGKAYNNLLSRVDLSEQFLLKCTPGSSCDGGYLQRALDKALLAGLPYQSDYPYYPFTYSYELNYGLCYTNDLVKISNMSRQSLYDVDDQTIIEVLQDGPITAAVGSTGWQYYSSGVFRCSREVSVDHAVLIVGYTSDYWILKNSWGTSFGENGYIRVTRNPYENCRIGVAVHKIWQFYFSPSMVTLVLFMLFILW